MKTRKRMQRFLSVLVTLTMILGMFPATALAVEEKPSDLPTATVTKIKNNDLTFALNFKANPATDDQLAKYGSWYADFVLTVNKDVTFNANGEADGYLSGQYDAWSDNWVNVPFEDVTLKAGESLKIMAYAAEMLGEPGLKYTYGEVYEFVKDFDCGVYFEDEFLQANPDLEVTLALRMYNNEDESESYVIGTTYTYTAKMVTPDLPTATVTELDNDELTFALNFLADEATPEQLAYYGDWYADFELKLNKTFTANADGDADGYLAGQYENWSEEWLKVPYGIDGGVTVEANTPVKVMESAAALMGQEGLKLTYNDVYTFVKEFNCGLFIEDAYLAANPDLVATLELRMYNPADESESYVIGRTYTFEVPTGEPDKDPVVELPADIVDSVVAGSDAASETEKQALKDAVESIVDEIVENTAVNGYEVQLPNEVETITITLSDMDVKTGTGEVVPTKITYTVEPKNVGGNKVSKPSEPITFRLPVPANVTAKSAKVYHDGVEMENLFTIQGSGNAKYVEISAKDFSDFAVEPINEPTAPAGVAKVGETLYTDLQAAVNAAQAGETVTLLADVALEGSYLEIGKSITIAGAHKITGNISVGYKTVAPTGTTLTLGDGVTVDGYIYVGDKTGDGQKYAAGDKHYLKVADGNTATLSGVNIRLTGVLDISSGATLNVTSDACLTGEVNVKEAYLLTSHASMYRDVTVTVDGGVFRHGYVYEGDGDEKGATVTVKNGGIYAADGWYLNGPTKISVDSASTVLLSRLNAPGAAEDIITAEAGASVKVFSDYDNANKQVVDSGYSGTVGETEFATMITNWDAIKNSVAVEDNELVLAPVTNVAEVNGVGYATLAEALAATVGMSGDVVVEIYDKVTLNTALYGSYDSIKFVGMDTDAEIYLDIDGYITATGKKVAFEGLTLSKSAGPYMSNAGFMNVAFGIYDVAEVTYTNCTLANGAYAASGKVTFDGCTFYRSHDRYGLWAYGNVDVVVDGCTFDDIRGIKMYAEGMLKTVDLTVKNTVFTNNVDNKPAIVLTCGESVKLENNTYSSTGVFELDLDGAPNGTPVTSDVPPTCVNDDGACGVLVDGKIYTTVAQAAEAASEGSTVTLLHDSTETVELSAGVTLDKNGFEAAGITVKKAAVAEVNGVGYETVQAAINAAQDGDTVVILPGEYGAINISNKNITIKGTVGENGELLTTIKGGNPAITGHGFNGTIRDLKIVDAFKVMYAEPAGNVTVDNVYVTGATYGFHLVAYSTGLTWKIQNSYMDLSWANSFGVYGNGDAEIIIKGNTFESTSPYYPDYGALHVNSFLPNVTVEENIFGENAKIMIRPSVADTSNVNISKNYHADGVENAFVNDGQQIEITQYYAELNDNGTINKDSLVEVSANVAEVNGVGYATLAEALSAAQAGDEIVLLADVNSGVTLPAGVIFNGNGYTVSGGLLAEGDITFKGYTKAYDFDVKYVNTTINIVEGACLELTGVDRLVIGHGCTFNIVGNITDAKTADKATIQPSLIVAAGASFTGTNLTFNVTNAYIKFNGNSTSKNSNANGTFNFNVTNSIWEQTGVLAFYVPTGSMDPTFNFTLKDSVLTTTSHLAFSVTKGEIVIDNSKVNEGTSRQIENRSTMTIKNGSVVNGAVATSSNAKNPGTIIVENATYAVTGEFSGSDLGTGTLIVKSGADVSVGSIVDKANIVIDATGMAVGDEVNFTGNLSKFTGTVEVINNDKLEAKIVDGKVVLAEKPVAKIGDTYYATLQEAIDAAQAGDTVTLLAAIDVGTDNALIRGKEITIDLNGKTITGNGYRVLFVDLKTSENKNGKLTLTGEGTVENTGTTAGNSYAVYVGGNSELVVENNVTVKSAKGYAVALFPMGAGRVSTLTVNGGTVTGRYAVSGSGQLTDTSTVVTVNGGAIIGTDVAIYQPQPGTVTVNGGTVTSNGDAAIAMRRGELTVTAGTVNGVVDIYGDYDAVTATFNGGDFVNATLKYAEGNTATKADSVELAAPEGYKWLNGTLTAKVYVAEVDGVKYETLAAAIDAAQAGETIKLIDNVVLSEVVVIPVGKTMTLDLNGKTVSMEESILTTAYAINNLGNLTLMDSVGGGSINARGIYNGYVDGGENVATAKLTVESGTYNAMGTNGGATIFNYGIVDINGGKFTSAGGYGLNNQAGASMAISNAEVNGGIYNMGSLTVENTKVYQHLSGKHAIYNWSATLVIESGEFDSVSGNELILADGQNSSVVINGGTFNKTAKSWLFGAATGKNISFTINDGIFNGYVNLPEGSVDTIRPYNDPIVVKGGMFNFDPTKWVAEGFEVKDNGDGTWTVQEKEETILVDLSPVKGQAAVYKDVVKLLYRLKEIKGYTEADILNRAQVLVWTGEDVNDEATYEKGTETEALTYEKNEGIYEALGSGIPAKNMGDIQKFRIYLVDEAGVVHYSPVYEYSLKQYAINMYGKASTPQKERDLLVALMNYGAAAQKLFNHRTDDLMNAWLPEDLQNVYTGYTAAALKADDAGKFNFESDSVWNRIGREAVYIGAIELQIKLDQLNAYKGAKYTLLYWNEETYNAATALTMDNATAVEMTEDSDGYMVGRVTKIPARSLGDTTYFCVMVEKDGETFYSALQTYSLHYYAERRIANANAQETEKNLCKSMLLYSNAAEKLFG